MTVALDRRCENCERTLGPSRRDRRFCSDRCRVASHRRSRATVAAETQALSPEQAEESASEERLVALVSQAAEKNWRAAAWILERRWPERWGPARLRARDVPPDPSGSAERDNVFAEIDELARKRRERLS